MKLFRRARAAPSPMMALWEAIVAEARRPHWYLRHGVPDTLDGRFDMVALVACLVMLRLEREGLRQEGVQLTERFVDDMDASLREIGVGDMVVGKHVGRMVGALGGRLGAYRAALAEATPPEALEAALARNVFRVAPESAPAGLPALAREVRALHDRISARPIAALLEGRL